MNTVTISAVWINFADFLPFLGGTTCDKVAQKNTPY